MLTTSTLWNYDFFFIFLFQDIEVGKAVRPQLAMRVSDAHAAWKKVSSSIFFLIFGLHECICNVHIIFSLMSFFKN
jgi:hypothetical protein